MLVPSVAFTPSDLLLPFASRSFLPMLPVMIALALYKFPQKLASIPILRLVTVCLKKNRWLFRGFCFGAAVSSVRFFVVVANHRTPPHGASASGPRRQRGRGATFGDRPSRRS